MKSVAHDALIIKNASQLLTIGKGPKTGEEMSELNVVENGAVAVIEGKIADVGNTKEIISAYEKPHVIDAEGCVVMPGFVDPHTHAVFSGTREDEMFMRIRGASYIEILAKGGGILRTMRATRAASMEKLAMESERRLLTMLRHGTTTAEVKSGYGLSTEHEIKMLRAINMLNEKLPIDLIPTFLGAHALPPEFKSTEDYIEDIVKNALPEIRRLALARFVDIFCDKGVFGLDDVIMLFKHAKDMGFGLKIHSDEMENLGATRVAAEFGAISADHLVKSTDEDLEALAKHGTVAVLLPGTPFILMSNEYPRARDMIEMGVPVALATDLNPNCYLESMQLVITLACLKMKMSAEEAIVASTINAASAIGVSDVVGSIEVGKKADIIVLDVENYEQLPYIFGVNHVRLVIKDGKVVYRRD
ncbi:MAG: imidazolonepropionase [Thermoplasmata archaeon]|nr:MAG: imidazolonepropionase [Thermoplasmata archaeon]